MFKVRVRWSNGSVTDFDIDKDAIVLGRDPESDVYLPSEHASRSHARVYRANDQTFIEDLSSANGTYVNQEKIKIPVAVTPKDPIKLGDVFIRVAHLSKKPKNPLDDSSYSLAQKLGDRRMTTKIDGGMGAELRKIFAESDKKKK